MVIVEALSHALPVICLDIGSMQEGIGWFHWPSFLSWQ